MIMIRRAILVFAVAAIHPPAGTAQITDTGSIFSAPIVMDSVLIKSGFDINAFVRRVRTDSSFYKAFRSMHLFPYTARNQVYVKGSNRDTIASMISTTRQRINNKCRTNSILERSVTGNYCKKNGDNNYYTGALFDYLFFTTVPVCNEDDIVAGNLTRIGAGKMELQKYRLKQLIFNPGAKISGIPFMADHENIFDESESYKYNFNVSMTTYNGEACYVFTITPRKGFERKVLYNNLVTWFRKSDYAILARDYLLSYHTLLYDFDVNMHVKTIPVNSKNCPSEVTYDGNWHIFTKKRERVSFTTTIEYDTP
jgi:hypothetical protein